MGKKGKKGKKSEDGGGAGDEANGSSGEITMSAEQKVEVLELKVTELMDKCNRYKEKCDTLAAENIKLGELEAQGAVDKRDIIEFLNNKQQENEKRILELEALLHQNELEKQILETNKNNEIAQLTEAHQQELFSNQLTIVKYKTELEQISDFMSKREDMENQLKFLKNLLEKKEKEYKETLYNLERKVIQDKNHIKKEMLQKVNEAVSNFRRVADQQMAETTKRAIRENMVITTQLKKMSTKTVELIQQNDDLVKKVTRLKTMNVLLVENEKELAKKSQASQRVVKMLVEKLKESDKMLEMAYDVYQLQEAQLEDHQQGRPIGGGAFMDEEQQAFDFQIRLQQATETASEAVNQANMQNLALRNQNLQQKLVECHRWIEDAVQFLDVERDETGSNDNTDDSPMASASTATLPEHSIAADLKKMRIELLTSRAKQIKELIDAAASAVDNVLAEVDEEQVQQDYTRQVAQQGETTNIQIFTPEETSQIASLDDQNSNSLRPTSAPHSPKPSNTTMHSTIHTPHQARLVSAVKSSTKSPKRSPELSRKTLLKNTQTESATQPSNITKTTKVSNYTIKKNRGVIEPADLAQIPKHLTTAKITLESNYNEVEQVIESQVANDAAQFDDASRTVGTQTRVAMGGATPVMLLYGDVRAWGAPMQPKLKRPPFFPVIASDTAKGTTPSIVASNSGKSQ